MVVDQLANFLLGEAKLEQFLEEHVPYEIASGNNLAKVGLNEAKQLLSLPAGVEGSRTTGSMDAQLLLGKLHFACGNITLPLTSWNCILLQLIGIQNCFHTGEYSDALQFLSEAGLDLLTEKPLPLRSLKIIAESFAVQALALEKLPNSSVSVKNPEEREQQLLKSMETAGDIALLYLQEQDKLQGESRFLV